MTQARLRVSGACPDLVVVRATEDDWRELRKVRLAALTDSPAAFGSNLQREEAFDEDRWRVWTRSAAVFIALRGGSSIGMAAGVCEDSVMERHLVAMWVDPAWRGHDAASKLVSSVIDWAGSEGSERLRLWVAEGNEPARRIYERRGFRATGARTPMPGNPMAYREEMVLQLR